MEGLYYLCSESLGTDQLPNYHTADLCLCFCICKSMFSHDAALIMKYATYLFFCFQSFSSKPALNAHLKIHMHNSKPVGRASPAELTSKSHGRSRKPSPSAARASVPKEQQEEGIFPCKLCGRYVL